MQATCKRLNIEKRGKGMLVQGKVVTEGMKCRWFVVST